MSNKNDSRRDERRDERRDDNSNYERRDYDRRNDNSNYERRNERRNDNSNYERKDERRNDNSNYERRDYDRRNDNSNYDRRNDNSNYERRDYERRDYERRDYERRDYDRRNDNSNYDRIPYNQPSTARPSVTATETKRNAFAIIHFGSNPVYLELELYFLKMLRQYTKNDIIYLYSVNDTPEIFVESIRPFATEVVPYDDRGITYDVAFKSEYTNFNTLRTCNYIFAYTLTKYDTVCIIESDMVIMKDIDSVFSLRSPAALTYYIGDRRLKSNDEIRNNPTEVLSKCKEMGRLNGGVMLINPSQQLFEIYKSKIQDVVLNECKYPNETLFEYVNNMYYNLPVQYNLSHYLAKPYKLQSFGLTPTDIYIYHFNETKYKHIDIIKNPIDETGENWLDIIQRDKKYEVKKFPILHYKNTVYDRYQPEISAILAKATSPVLSESKKSAGSPYQSIKSKSSTKSKKSKRKKGTRKGNCRFSP